MAAERIDVLAVMDAMFGWANEVSDDFIDASGFRTEYVRDLRQFLEARAAVAELIEADKEYDEARAEFYAVAMARETANERYMRQGRYITAGKRRAAALARVGEGA